MPPLKWGTGHVPTSELGPHFVGENSYECPHFNGLVGAPPLPLSLSLSFLEAPKYRSCANQDQRLTNSFAL